MSGENEEGGFYGGPYFTTATALFSKAEAVRALPHSWPTSPGGPFHLKGWVWSTTAITYSALRGHIPTYQNSVVILVGNRRVSMSNESQEPRTQGFTLVFDSIIEFYAPDLKRGGARNRAVVYGVIYRYWKMRLGYCYETVEKMATQADMARSTFKDHLDALVSDGWVRCLYASRGGRNLRSSYEVTSKQSDLMEQETLRPPEGIGPKLSNIRPKPSDIRPKPSDHRRGLKEIIKRLKGNHLKETIGSAAEKIREPEIKRDKEKDWMFISAEEQAERDRLLKRERLSVAELAKRVAEEKRSNGRALDPAN